VVSASGIDVLGHPVASGGEAPGALPGRMYRLAGADHLVRIAKVIDVRPDTMGIPHVHFELRVGRGFDRPADFEETRTLSLETFVGLFREAIDH